MVLHPVQLVDEPIGFFFAVLAKFSQLVDTARDLFVFNPIDNDIGHLGVDDTSSHRNEVIGVAEELVEPTALGQEVDDGVAGELRSIL